MAKASADIIILDDNFNTIVTVAKWGRAVYTNIQKFVQFQLTVNLVALTINFISACITGIVNLQYLANLKYIHKALWKLSYTDSTLCFIWNAVFISKTNL